MACAGVLCQGERGVVLLTNCLTLAGLIVPSTELSTTHEVIPVACFKLHAQKI